MLFVRYTVFSFHYITQSVGRRINVMSWARGVIQLVNSFRRFPVLHFSVLKFGLIFRFRIFHYTVNFPTMHLILYAYDQHLPVRPCFCSRLGMYMIAVVVKADGSVLLPFRDSKQSAPANQWQTSIVNDQSDPLEDSGRCRQRMHGSLSVQSTGDDFSVYFWVQTWMPMQRFLRLLSLATFLIHFQAYAI